MSVLERIDVDRWGNAWSVRVWYGQRHEGAYNVATEAEARAWGHRRLRALAALEASGPAADGVSFEQGGVSR